MHSCWHSLHLYRQPPVGVLNIQVDASVSWTSISIVKDCFSLQNVNIKHVLLDTLLRLRQQWQPHPHASILIILQDLHQHARTDASFKSEGILQFNEGGLRASCS